MEDEVKSEAVFSDVDVACLGLINQDDLGYSHAVQLGFRNLACLAEQQLTRSFGLLDEVGMFHNNVGE